MTSMDEHGIPFSLFVSLVHEIGKIKPHRASEKQPRSTRYADMPAYRTFTRWVKMLRAEFSPHPPDTTATVFRFLFPEEDVRRKYGLQETRLARHLVKILGVSTERHGRGERLKNWKEGDVAGCLGAEIQTVMAATADSQASTTDLTLGQVDALLTELAAKCAFSEHTVHTSSSSRRTREAILTSLYTSLTPAECAVVTQIILKDLRPLLYPVPRSAMHYTAALLEYKSNAVAVLTKEAAMHVWDPSSRMKAIYSNRASLEDAAREYDQLLQGGELPQPEIGKQIQIPKCVKGQGTVHSLRKLHRADKIWVETKYDGERAQIHVHLDKAGVPHIRIFSKSGRESTLDRAGVHDVIYDALGLSRPGTLGGGRSITLRTPTFKTNIIVEAEMVAFSDALNRIDEFWRIRSLIATTAIGVRHKSLRPPIEDAIESQCSLVSNASDGGTRHLALVFFDILLLDDVSLLRLPYCERRLMLEEKIQVLPGRAMLAERTCIDMTHPNADEHLRAVFARLIADREEGAVLKADGAQYADRKCPWVKLKRDYIPGYGDAVDLVLLAASWEKDRGRELRVPTAAYTTFYFGALANGDALREDPACRPHFEAIFPSSYCPSREELEEWNFIIKKSSDLVPYSADTSGKLPYTYYFPSGIPRPEVFLQEPLLAELFGAGFTKSQGNMFYELRFPRISKVFRPSDRAWMDGISLAEFQLIARTAVGRDRPGKAEDDWARSMFRPNEPASPGVRCPKKRKQTETLWIHNLEAVDKKAGGRLSPLKRARIQDVETKRMNTDVRDAENTGSSVTVPKAGRIELLKSKAGLSRLGSVTNLATVPSSPIRHSSDSRTVSPPPSPPPQVVPHVAEKISPVPASRTSSVLGNPGRPPLNLRTPGNRPHAVASVQPSSRPSPQPARDENAPLAPPLPSPQPAPTAPPPTDDNDDSACNPSTIITPPATLPPSTLHHFLQDSVVWLARPSGSSRPSWRAPTRAVIPLGNQVHTLDAVLLACGWVQGSRSGSAACGWASRGVVFVDDSESEGGRACAEQTLGTLVVRRQELLAAEKTEGLKPVFVFSMRMLAYDALDVNATREELEARAICRFG